MFFRIPIENDTSMPNRIRFYKSRLDVIWLVSPLDERIFWVQAEYKTLMFSKETKVKKCTDF